MNVCVCGVGGNLHIFTVTAYSKLDIHVPCLHTVELQWLEHLWNHENMFETEVDRANECLSERQVGGIIRIYYRFSLI